MKVFLVSKLYLESLIKFDFWNKFVIFNFKEGILK